VTAHLASLGHRRFALAGISPDYPLGRVRYRGVMRALAAAKISAEPEILSLPNVRPAGLRYGRQLAEILLARSRRPTAILAINDEVAAGVLWRLQKAGLSCPGDFSLVGFDNLALSEQTTPALSTVDHNVEVVAAAAVDLLAQLIELGPNAKLPVVKIEPHLILRESIAAPPR
jgi:DNA-binding LacI/PurR family transcriptional regulator